MRVLHYLNPFFSQLGEEKTNMAPMRIEGAVGPGRLFNSLLKEGQIVATVVCGDNYYAENMDKAREEVLTLIRKDSRHIYRRPGIQRRQIWDSLRRSFACRHERTRYCGCHRSIYGKSRC